MMRCVSVVMGLLMVGALGCSEGEEKPDYLKFGASKCATDKDCAKGFICTAKPDGKDPQTFCLKGERSKEELAKRKKDELAKKKAEEEARKKKAKEVKPGESTLTVRLCPGFVNTPEATGTIHAVNQETKKAHFMILTKDLEEQAYETEFTFPSLPLGKYDVTVDYGIIAKTPRGPKPDTIKMKCHKKAEPCRDEIIREMEVIALADSYKPGAKDKDGKPIRKDCDFIAE